MQAEHARTEPVRRRAASDLNPAWSGGFLPSLRCLWSRWSNYAHCARAKAAGAPIVREPVTQNYGGRDYTCKDSEGHLWTFGTYDPNA